MRYDMRLLAAACAAAIAAAAAPALAQDVQAGIAAWQAGNYEAAITQWRPLADRGDADAQYNLAQAYKLGRGVPVNLNLAEQWYERAARQGHEQAGANLGLILFQNGQRQRAMPYIQAAADRGDPRAQYVLGTALFNGDVVGRDHARAYAYMSAAAAAGLPPAVSQLRDMEQHVAPEDRSRGTQLASAIGRNAPRAMASADPAVTGPVTARPSAPPAQSRPRIADAQMPPSSAQPSNERRYQPDFNLSGEGETAPPPPRQQPRQQPVQRTRPAPAAAAPLASAGGLWRVQLGAFSNDANARRAWASVSARLGGLRPLYSRAGALIRLQAGPLATRAAADRACAAARSAGSACIPVAP